MIFWRTQGSCCLTKLGFHWLQWRGPRDGMSYQEPDTEEPSGLVLAYPLQACL